MNDDDLLRYSRQIILPEFGIEAQQRLIDSHVLIVGLGGLGSPAALYLAAAGIGRLTLADGDRVDLSNLQRQIAHRTDRIGETKVESARATCLALNPSCRIDTIDRYLDDAELADTIATADCVLDCTDNFGSRFAINRHCRAAGIPLVSGAAIRWEGHIGVFGGKPADPCYRCLYGDGENVEETCSENGVMAPLVGVIGSLQALEAIKIISGVGDTLNGRLLILDTLSMQWRQLRLKQDPQCPVCQNQ